MTTATPFSEKIPCILIVDDTLANLELLSGVISEHGYEPRPVPNGKLALLAAQTEPPDLILLDINMPGMDGFEVCEQLKANEATRDIPVIFITAYAETEDKVRGLGLGAVDYITKPFQIDEVRMRVDTHLKMRSLQQRLHLQNQNLEQQVAERTNELLQANEMLLKLGRLSHDFLSMISYEIRTPANGVLGIGELLISLCPETEESSRYMDLFRGSGARLVQLIQDAALIAEIEKSDLKSGAFISFGALLAEVRAALADVQVNLMAPAGLGAVRLQGDQALLKRVLETLVLLAVSFSANKRAVRLGGAIEDGRLRLRCELDSLRMSAASAADFFMLESQERAKSDAEALGLAPVVAYKILSIFGGELKLVKGNGNTGSLEALLTMESVN
jgi:two-component system, sensor histidine kinase and response regulator